MPAHAEISEPPTATTGVVLAAGDGSRLGRGPKALLRQDGQTLVDGLVAALHDGGCDEVVVVLGAEADRVRAEATLAGAHVVENPAWTTGMASSLRLGISTALARGAARVVVALVDQPDVGPDVVARVLAAHRPGRAVVSRWADAGRRPNAHRGRAHPLVLDAALAERVARGAQGDRGGRDVLDAHADLIDVVEHPGDGRDVDTAADLDLLG
ncbi:nucleotidyltransferase family protein [Oerskovia flava]|uniref:nucleotidyltransferase family protein n=1 Tax=Oerskovia flava TaxID=2986422 RepID=UPI0022407579|nr:nucleotidyltransferase family protein [Oerskovia sp. JB1-3-2]